MKRAETALAAFNASNANNAAAAGGVGGSVGGGVEKPQATVSRSESTAGATTTGVSSVRGTNRERRAAIPSTMTSISESAAAAGGAQGEAIERDPPSTSGAAASNADVGSNGPINKPESSSKAEGGGSGLSYGSVFSQLQGLISGASTKPDVKLERKRKEEDEALHKVCLTVLYELIYIYIYTSIIP